MELNADFSQRVLIHSEDLPWVASPMAGVDRRMLDRIGDEVARATSIVRYAKGSQFSAHAHGGGEEFLVLEGTFQDEHGDYPAGTYVRNPPTTAHTPGAEDGCVIFVKLWQFATEDRNQFRKSLWSEMQAAGVGVSIQLLHDDSRETVRAVALQADACLSENPIGGAEVLVLDGSLSEGEDVLRQGSWLRLPDGAPMTLRAGPDGAKLWIKTGHLRFAAAPKLNR